MLIVLVGATLGTVNARSSALLIVRGFAGASFGDTVIDALWGSSSVSSSSA